MLHLLIRVVVTWSLLGRYCAARIELWRWEVSPCHPSRMPPFKRREFRQLFFSTKKNGRTSETGKITAGTEEETLKVATPCDLDDLDVFLSWNCTELINGY